MSVSAAMLHSRFVDDSSGRSVRTISQCRHAGSLLVSVLLLLGVGSIRKG